MIVIYTVEAKSKTPIVTENFRKKTLCKEQINLKKRNKQDNMASPRAILSEYKMRAPEKNGHLQTLFPL